MSYTNYGFFSNEPLSNTKRFAFTNNDKLTQGEFEVFDENSMTAENVYNTSFLLLQQSPKSNSTFMKDTQKTINNLTNNSELSKMFFSDINIKRIQKLLRTEIFTRSKGKFKMDVDQDEKELVYVMRAIYIEHARYIPNQIVRQVKILNKKVIDEVMPSIITSIQHNYGYLKRINNPIDPIQRPVNVNNAGRKLLPGFSTIWEF